MEEYIQHLLSYVDTSVLKPMKLVCNAGHGAAGPVLDKLSQLLPFDIVKINNQIVTVDFSKKSSSLRYVSIQKTRKIRIAFASLDEYSRKENRNGYTYTNQEINVLKAKTFSVLSGASADLKAKKKVL